ncbi:MAG: non-canonical purine NTP pyrophosphatase, partial [Campylobacterales bacterium]
MDIVLATSNNGKVREIKKFADRFNVVTYSSLIEPFEIVEDGESFKENALIKARAVYDALKRDDIVVLADDSGISVEALSFGPGIYSARFAKEGASDIENLQKMIDSLKKLGIKKSYAYYTCSIAIVGKGFEYTTHGFMHGE